jgi:hypothetical protein
MRKDILIPLILFILMIVHCGYAGTDFTKKGTFIENGYSPKMVKDILGRPGRIENQDDIIKWYYKSSDGIKIMLFENDKLTIVFNREC